MMLEAHEVTEALEARRHDQRVLDTYGALRPAYDDWHADVREVYRIYANEFDVVWPDGAVTRGLPKIANFLALAADDRAREVAATIPTLVCRPERGGDNAKQAAEKRERILQGYWERNRIPQMIPRLAHDAMSSGLTAVLVWPDLREKDRTKRYPLYRRMEPLRSYPDPVFSQGPFLDSFIYAYEETVRNVEKRFNVRLSWRRDPANSDHVRIVEYYDDSQVTIVAEAMSKYGASAAKKNQIVLQEAHDLKRCPVVIGTRPTMDAVYRSEFLGGLGVTNTLNRLITMMLDDASNKVYSPTLSYGIENPQDIGPGAHLEADNERARFEWVQPPNQPFSNLQIVRDLTGAARAANLIPPSRSGDPNESIISAAGISASQSQFVSDVRSIQRDVLAPMFEAANEIAFMADEAWGGERKPVYAFASQREDYDPTKDIKGNYRNKVVYGMGSGLDEINQNVMVLQQLGGGLVSRRTAMEMSPFVEDPGREEKQMAIEQLDQATFAGLVAQAQQGLLDPRALAQIRRAVESDNTSLADAIETFTAQAPLASPRPTGPGAPPEAPGIAGAAEGPQPSNMPDLASLLGGG